jgi:hypothetical protein
VFIARIVSAVSAQVISFFMGVGNDVVSVPMRGVIQEPRPPRRQCDGEETPGISIILRYPRPL